MRGAGGGRPPKPDGQKTGHYKPTHETVVLPAKGRDEAPPPIFEFKPSQQKVWDALWALPAASQWQDEDVPALSRMVFLQTKEETCADNRLLAELRQLEDRFGLSPYARRQLRWESAEDEPAKPKRRSNAKLRVVDQGG